MPYPSSRPLVFALLLAAAFVAGGSSPLRAGVSAEDAIARQLERLTERLTDAIKDLGRREVVCSCKCS